MINQPNVVNETPLYKELTITELSRTGKRKYFYTKEGFIIFPMDGKFVVIVSELFDGETLPLLDEFRMAQLLNIVGKIGWNKCYFKESINSQYIN